MSHQSTPTQLPSLPQSSAITSNSNVSSNNDQQQVKHPPDVFAGLDRIKALDAILKQKALQVQQLRKAQKELTNNLAQSAPSSNTTSDHDVFYLTDLAKSQRDINDDERESVAVRARIDEKVAERLERMKQAKSKPCDRGDFIQRNIQLGADARYFFALTEEERKRLESLLHDEEQHEESTQDSADQSEPHEPTERPSIKTTHDAGFHPSTDEISQLCDIETKLKKMIPSSEWETKSIGLMSTSFNDGTSVAFWSQTNENTTVNKDVNRVMNENIGGSLEMLSQWRQSIRAIDERLHELRHEEDNEHQEPLSRTDLDRLLMECVKANMDRDYKDPSNLHEQKGVDVHE